MEDFGLLRQIGSRLEIKLTKKKENFGENGTYRFHESYSGQPVLVDDVVCSCSLGGSGGEGNMEQKEGRRRGKEAEGGEGGKGGGENTPFKRVS
jgi:hypothetical protein